MCIYIYMYSTPITLTCNLSIVMCTIPYFRIVLLHKHMKDPLIAIVQYNSNTRGGGTHETNLSGHYMHVGTPSL